jgi:ACS family glucarate transporter-like MFS transporter
MPRPSPQAPAAWRVLALLALFAFLCHFNRLAISVVGTERLIKGGVVDETRMGWVYTAYLIVYTVCMTPGGWLMDRWGAKRMLALMGFAAAGGAMLTGLLGLAALPAAALFPALIVVRGLVGVANVPMHPGAARAVGLWFPPAGRSFANGCVTAAALVGITSTYVGFGWLMDKFGWPMAFVFAGGATLLAAMAWTALVPADPRPPGSEGPRPAESWAPLLSRPSLWLLTASYAAVGYFQYLFFYWAEHYFNEVLLLAAGTGRRYTTLVTGAMVPGMLFGGWLSDLIERRFPGGRRRAWVPVAGMLLSAALLFLGTLRRDPDWALGFFAAAMFFLGSSESAFWVSAVEVGGRLGGAAASIMNTGGNAGGLLAPLMTPILSERLGWQQSLLVAGVFSVLGALCWCGIDLRRDGEREAGG